MNVIERLGFEQDVELIKHRIAEWVERSDSEMREMLRWQFLDRSKYFRPVTVFACNRAMNGRAAPIPESVVRSAVILEKLHNVTLIIDDILDKSEKRRGKLTLYCKFGTLPALMAAGYIMAEAFQDSADDPLSTNLFANLFKRLGAGECLQWRLRRTPLGVEDWRKIAGEDTGSMFETCACLGTRDTRLQRFGHLLGLLYHGCDDVGDVRGARALGEGGEADLRDGILTLPAAIAIRDPQAARIFENLDEISAPEFMAILVARLPEAEAYLDRIALEAGKEAESFAREPAQLLTLIEETRKLSTG